MNIDNSDFKCLIKTNYTAISFLSYPLSLRNRHSECFPTHGSWPAAFNRYLSSMSLHVTGSPHHLAGLFVSAGPSWLDCGWLPGNPQTERKKLGLPDDRAQVIVVGWRNSRVRLVGDYLLAQILTAAIVLSWFQSPPPSIPSLAHHTLSISERIL